LAKKAVKCTHFFVDLIPKNGTFRVKNTQFSGVFPQNQTCITSISFFAERSSMRRT